jgi:type II secretory pathway pseudopilin PulG
MDKSQMRVRREFVLGLALVGLFAILVSLLLPTSGGPTRAKISLTQIQEREIASALSQYAAKVGGATNIDEKWVFQAVVGSQSFSHPVRTNLNGEILDFWDVPYRIVPTGQTNFVVHSAGKNHTFGDADDIIFNSRLNTYVKP